MRYIFVDEAGTSAEEPITVVVGVICDADYQVILAERLMAEATAAISAWHEGDFVFHAMDIFSGNTYKKEWSPTDRMKVLHSVMSIPARLRMGISVAAVWRDGPDFHEEASKLGVSKEQFQQFMAFSSCLAKADAWIREMARPEEHAIVVAENVEPPAFRSLLKGSVDALRSEGFFSPRDLRRKTKTDEEAGHSKQSGDLRISRIRDPIHFVQKNEDPLVQVADACAFGIRRALEGREEKATFLNSIFSNPDALQDFGAPSGTVVFSLPFSRGS